MNKLFKILEVFWLCMAGIAAVVAVYFLVIKDNDSALFFVFVFLISAVLFLIRRYQRKSQEKFLAESASRKKK